MQGILNFRQSLDGYLKIIDTRMEEKDFLGALDAGRRAIESAKTRVDKESINVILGQIYFEMGLYFLSCEHFFRAMCVPETRVSALFGVGRNLVMMKNEKLALTYFDAVLESGGAEEFSGAVLEWVYQIKKNLNEPQDSSPLFAIAKNLVKLGKYEQAITTLSPLFVRGDYLAKNFIADVLILKRDYEKAREIIFNILRDNPENVQANLLLCNLCLAEKDFCSMEINLSKLENLQLDCAQEVLVANLYFGAGKWQKAIDFYKKSLKNDEFNIKTLLFTAISYFNSGDKENALYYLGQARWVDIENPTLNIYLDIFTRDLVVPPLKLTTQLPKKIVENKLQEIFGLIENGILCDSLNSSLTLADDIDWCMTYKNSDLINRLTNALSKCKKKKAQKMYQKYLLSVRLDKEQKFYLTKYAMLAQNLKEIDLTSNLVFRSFKNKIPQIITNSMWQEGYCNAISYAEINGFVADFDNINAKIYQYVAKNQHNFTFNERVLSCIYFCNNAQVLGQACIYFGVESEEVLRAINEFQLLV